MRSVPEWVGKTPDSAIPERVQLRVIDATDGCCAVCGSQFGARNKPEVDHIMALVNWSKNILGGHGNRESNLQALCKVCHAGKTVGDVGTKAQTARMRKKHLGIKPRKPGGFQTNRDGKFKKKMDGSLVLR